MDIRYICKKEFDLNSDIQIKYGTVVQITFVDSKSFLTAIHKMSGTEKCYEEISDDELKNHFYLYDEMYTLEPVVALTYFVHKFKTMTKQGDMLKDLKYYIKERYQFLNQCNKEDIQQEQNGTQEPHTTNQ